MHNGTQPSVRPLCIACWLFALGDVTFGLMVFAGLFCGSQPSSLNTLSQPLPTSLRKASIFFRYISPLILQSWISGDESLSPSIGGNCGIVDVSRIVLSRGTSGWLDERRGSIRG